MFRQILRRAFLAPVCRRDTLKRRFAKACRTMAAPLVAILAFAHPTADAAPVITGLNYTGTGYADGTGGPDSHWKVAAVPVDGSVTTATPYAAWVFSGTGTQLDPTSWTNVPDPWFSGHNNLGFAGGRWIGAQENNTTALLPDSAGGPPLSLTYYTTIYSTTFQSSEAGTAYIWLRTAADNAVTFFVNGTISGGTGNQATIINGSQVAARIQGLATLKTVAGNVSVNAGTNTLYAVVEDRFNPVSHSFGYTGLIVVPEPSTMSSVGVAAGGIAVAAAGRRLRRRPRN